MSLSRIQGLMLQELYITKHSLEVVVDLFYFSVISIIVFGFFSTFLSSTANSSAAHYFLIGTILWEIVRISQYSISVGGLWNIWSRNLSNMFVAPLSLTEYLTAAMISGAIKALITFFLISVIALYLYNFNIFTLGFANLSLFFLNLMFFAWSIGIIVLAIIFRYGTRIQALAWGLIFIFQPLSATFFPVSILPAPLQTVAYLFPSTHVFEAARASLTNPSIDWAQSGIAFLENIIYFLLSLWIFNAMYNKSKETGQFARNEG